MRTNIFSLLALGTVLTFTACQGTGDGTTPNSDSVGAIEREPDNTRTDETTPSTATTLDNNTRDFVMEAAEGGMMEVELGQLAQQKAVNQRVKDFGAMMVRDHSKSGDELKQAVAGKNVTIPATLSDKHRDHVNDLNKKTGIEFDKAYMEMMVDDHEKDIKKFESIEKDANDPAVRNYATNALPVLRNHLESAKSIRDELKAMKK